MASLILFLKKQFIAKILIVLFSLLLIHPALASSACASLNKKGICIRLGENYVLQTLDVGKTWQAFYFDINNVEDLHLGLSYCYSLQNKNICLAGGGIITGSAPDVYIYPVLAQSNNGGLTWDVIYQHQGRHGVFSDATCMETKNGPVCLTVAGDASQYTNEFNHILLRTVNNGASWEKINIQNLPLWGQLLNLACTQDGALCIMSGMQYLLHQSKNLGTSWEEIKISTPNVAAGKYNGLSCSGKQDNSICIAVGSSNQNKAFITQTRDEGKTWKSIPHLPENAYFVYAKCVKNALLSSCVTIGAMKREKTKFILAETKDNGAHWSFPLIKGKIPYLDAYPAVTNLYCNDTPSFCLFSIRYNEYNRHETILVRRNENVQWEVIRRIPQALPVDSVNCLDSGYCFVTGYDAKLLMESFDYGKTWSIKNSDHYLTKTLNPVHAKNPCSGWQLFTS